MGFLDYKGLERFLKNSREEFAQKSHTHDERYYTEYEIDNKLSKKSDVDHIHDDRYYTEAEVDGKLEGKSSTDHTHDLSELISALSIGPSTTLNDAVQIITQDTNTANQKYYRRSLSVLWNYIKSKADSVYSAIGHNHKIQNLEDYTTRVYDATIVRPADTVLASPQDKDGIATFRKLDKNDVGLENVDNTADKNKNVATAGIATTGVRDYNNANNIIKIGWSGTELDADSLAYVAGYTSDKKIHPASKDGVRSWLGLGDSAYKNTKSRSSKGSTDWTNNATDDAIVPTMSFMAYWDGAYNSNGTSNLSYCDRGRFGTIVTKNTGDYAVAGHTHNSIKDIGNNSSDTTFAYSKAGMNYGDYTWLAGWNGYELRAVNKSQFAIAGHTHGLNSTSLAMAVSNATTNSWDMVGGNGSRYLLRSLRMQANAPAFLENNYAAGIVFGGEDTKGTLSVAYHTPAFKIAGGNGSAPVWWMRLTGSSGTTYNLNSMPYAQNANSANGVKDYNDANRTIKIGYAGSGLNTSNLSHIAGFTDNGTKIKDVSKDVLTSWIGLGNYLPLSGGTMSGQITKSTGGSWIGDRDRAAIKSSYAGDSSYGAVAAMATKNGYWTIGNLGGNESLIFNYSTDSNYNAGNNSTSQVYLPAQAGTIITSATIGNQTVNTATCANYLNFTAGNEINFNGTPSDNTVYVGYRNTSIREYRFNNGAGNGGLASITAAAFNGKATSAGSADSATTSNGVKDYNDANRTIKIGYAGSGLNTSNLSHIAGFTDNGTKIKDVSKDVLKGWIGQVASATSADNGVVASGSNYVRFGDGTQICWYTNLSSGSILFYVPFIDTNYAIVCFDRNLSGVLGPVYTDKQTTGVGLKYVKDVVCIGRWK